MHLPSNNPRRALLKEFFDSTKLRFESAPTHVVKKPVHVSKIPKLKVDIELMRSIFETRARRDGASTEDDEEPMLSPRPRRDSKVNELVSKFDSKSSSESSFGSSPDFSKPCRAETLPAYPMGNASQPICKAKDYASRDRPVTLDRSQSGSKVERLKAFFDSPALPKKEQNSISQDSCPSSSSSFSSSESSPQTPHYVNIDLSSISSAFTNIVIKDHHQKHQQQGNKTKDTVDKGVLEYDSIKENILFDLAKNGENKRLWNCLIPNGSIVRNVSEKPNEGEEEEEAVYHHLNTWTNKRPKEDTALYSTLFSDRRESRKEPAPSEKPLNDAATKAPPLLPYQYAKERAVEPAVLRNRILNQDSDSSLDNASSGTLTNGTTPDDSVERNLWQGGVDLRSGSPRPALKPRGRKVRHKVARRRSSNRKSLKPVPRPRTRVPPPSLHLYANLPPSRPLPPIVPGGGEPSLDDVVPLTSPSPFKGNEDAKTDDEWVDCSDLEVPLIIPYAVSPTLPSGEAAPYDHLASFHPKYIGTRGVLKGHSEPNLFKNRELAINHHYERLNSSSSSSASRQHFTLDLPTSPPRQHLTLDLPTSPPRQHLTLDLPTSPLRQHLTLDLPPPSQPRQHLTLELPSSPPPEVFPPSPDVSEPRTPRTVSVATQAGPCFERSASRKSLGRLLRSARSSKKSAPKETATFYAELSTVDKEPVAEMTPDIEEDSYDVNELPPWLREDADTPIFPRSPEQLLTSRSYLVAAMRTETLGPRASWCDLPDVQQSGILEAISAQELKLQESIWRLYVAQARHFRTLDHGIARCEGIKAALCPAQRALLFADLLALRDIARKLLTELEEHWEGSILLPTDVGELLHRHATQHSALNVKYCSNQRFQHRSLAKLMKEQARMKEAVESSLGLGPLSSLLAAPAVHLAQLPRLLATVLHWLPRNSPDHHACRLALDAFTKLVAEGREGSRRMDKMEEMLVLSHQLEFKECRALPLISASRWLVKHGELARIEPLSPRRAFSRSSSRLSLFLFNDLLLIAKKKSEESYSVVDYCPKSELDVSEDNGLLRVTLHSHHQERPLDLVLRCSCESDHLRWLSALTKDPQSPSTSTPPPCPEGRVRCLKNFHGQQHDELTLEVGDILQVLRTTQDGWCEGEREGGAARGWFPVDHTTPLHSDDELWLRTR